MAPSLDSTGIPSSETFRATFLSEIEDPGTRATVVAFGSLIMELIREAPLVVASDDSDTPRSVPRESFMAALTEITDVAIHLRATVEASKDHFELLPEDAELASRAGNLAKDLFRLVEASRRSLP